MLFLNSTAIGAPVVCPAIIPLRICGLSSSFRGVVPLAPLLRLERSIEKSSSESTSPAGTPSITTPIPSPWDSPKTETLKFFPKISIMHSIRKTLSVASLGLFLPRDGPQIMLPPARACQKTKDKIWRRTPCHPGLPANQPRETPLTEP